MDADICLKNQVIQCCNMMEQSIIWDERKKKCVKCLIVLLPALIALYVLIALSGFPFVLKLRHESLETPIDVVILTHSNSWVDVIVRDTCCINYKRFGRFECIHNAWRETKGPVFLGQLSLIGEDEKGLIEHFLNTYNTKWIRSMCIFTDKTCIIESKLGLCWLIRDNNKTRCIRCLVGKGHIPLKSN